MEWQIKPTWAGPIPGAQGKYLAEVVSKITTARRPGRLMLTGTDSVTIASLAVLAVNRGWQVVFPAGENDLSRWHEATYTFIVLANLDRSHIRQGLLAVREGTWDVAMSTSGTTKAARTYGFALEQITSVCRQYHKLYQLEPTATIVTALPAAHNFAFIAGVCTAAELGARVVFAAGHQDVLTWLNVRPSSDRVVVLASPVLLQSWGTELPQLRDVLVDSGAAPVSRPHLLRLRRQGADIREGYGTTETLSLTHFDTDGTIESAGTVGYPVDGVACEVGKDHRVTVSSPFTGTRLDEFLSADSGEDPSWIGTGDLGLIDAAGRLRLIGRVGDVPVGGCWPRDILDELGDLLGSRTASVQTSPGLVHLTSPHQFTPDDHAGIADIVSRLTGLPRESVAIHDGHRHLTYSLKVPRVAAVPSEGDHNAS